MRALESMINKLKPLKIYDTSTTSYIYAELAAYAAALDYYRDMLDEALRECFVSTAKTFGLETREKFVGDVRKDCSTEQRRAMLSTRASLGETDYTLSGFDKFMKSFGVQDYTLNESAITQSVTVIITGDYSSNTESWIINQIKLTLPAHLSMNVYAGGRNWQAIDSGNEQYATFDSRDYTWKQLNTQK
ncbi:MAG: hypothetical protein J1E96_07370 [Ruminococcus sp.]|nr:hypothetical protein [Ruminococcus sp.]